MYISCPISVCAADVFENTKVPVLYKRTFSAPSTKLPELSDFSTATPRNLYLPVSAPAEAYPVPISTTNAPL